MLLVFIWKGVFTARKRFSTSDARFPVFPLANDGRRKARSKEIHNDGRDGEYNFFIPIKTTRSQPFDARE